MAEKSCKGLKILIVDDENDARYFLERFLKKKGCKDVKSVATGEEALSLIEKEDINLVLLDIKLPRMDGIEVLRKIKQIKKDTNVIMITAFPDDKKTKEAMELGAYDYIVKPFDLAYLELSLFTKIIVA